jgi:O-succinylbenzoic acid--CoA ligase
VNEALSILAAAREAPAAAALRIGAQAYTYADLAELVHAQLPAVQAQAPGLFALTASNTLDTLVTLYTLLEAHRPALLLYPRQTAAEHAAILADAARAGGALPPDAAAVIHTSGTTGRPRGAVLTRAALLASARASAANMGWVDGDCWLLAMPLARVGGLSIVTRCLAARRTVALAPAFDARQLPAWIEAQGVTLVSLVPTMLAQCLDAHPDWTPPPTLRAVQLGGAAASARLLQRAAQRGWPIVITYGCTETASQVASTPYRHRFEAAAHGVGRPLPGAELRVLDGRIEVRGPMRMAGYLGEPPLDAQTWFDTGDLGEFDAAGNLHLLARRHDLIVTGGEKVYPVEVEQVLESCPGVQAAAVFGLPDPTWGQTVAAALVLGPQPPGDDTLLAHLGARLAAYKRPRQICALAALPRTGADKLDRAALLAMRAQLRPLRSA